jgi:hypothetical protein
VINLVGELHKADKLPLNSFAFCIITLTTALIERLRKVPPRPTPVSAAAVKAELDHTRTLAGLSSRVFGDS